MVYFQTKNPNFGLILEGLAMQDVGILDEHLVYFTDIGYSLWTFSIFCGNVVYFVVMWYIVW
jgi:hypothetical protein